MCLRVGGCPPRANEQPGETAVLSGKPTTEGPLQIPKAPDERAWSPVFLPFIRVSSAFKENQTVEGEEGAQEHRQAKREDNEGESLHVRAA